MNEHTIARPLWSSRFGFFMAAIGSSVGLGNFWRFPYTAGENGGGAFILAYILCVICIALPILMAEYTLGRRSGLSAIEGIRTLAIEDKRSQKWSVAGWVGMCTAFMILTFYNVICAWILAYIPQAMSGDFAAFSYEAASTGLRTIEVAANNFNAVINDTGTILSLLFLFIAANVTIVAMGVKNGLEKAAKILMPLFFLALAMMVVYAGIIGDFAQTADFLLRPKWADVGFGTLLAAIGQAFFSVGVGVGLMLTYGSYLPKNTHIPRASAVVAGCDTLVAVIAGFAVFPIIFAFGGSPASGPGLFFVSMPLAFGDMAGGTFISSIFFLLALFAAFTSSISLLEVPVSWLQEQKGISRPGAAIGAGLLLFLIGAAYVFSLAYLDFVDFITEGLLLPLGGLLIALFAGRVLDSRILHEEIGSTLSTRLIQVWLFLLRWVVPVFVGLVLVFGLLDKLQDTYGLTLPQPLVWLLGPNK